MKKLLLFFMSFFTIFSYAQFPEGFENASFPPAGWARFDNGIGLAQQWNETTNATLVYAGAKAAFLNRENVTDGTTALDWLVSPVTTVPANGQLRFYTRKTQNGNFGSIYTIRVSTTSQTTAASFTTVQTWTEADLVTTYNVYEQKFVNLSAYAGQNVYIAFVMENDNGDRWLVDNINLDPICQVNTALTATPLATSASLSWTSPNTGPWEIEYGPAGFVQGTGTIVSAATNTNFVISPLNPLTNYSFYVRTLCAADNPSAWSAVGNFQTSALPPGCGGNFIDSGGASGAYSNSENITTTICPTTAGDMVTVFFTSFNTEATWDALYVYDGPSTASPLIASTNGAGNVPGGLAGGWWGTTVPGPFTSTHPSGCLTFVFRSDTSVTNPGWTANVTCGPPPACVQPSGLTVTNITSDSATLSWIDNNITPPVGGWQIVVQPVALGYPTGTSTIIMAPTSTFTVTNLTPNTSYEFYVLSDCGSTDGVSFWSGPRAFNTLFPGCNGSTPAGDICATAAPVCNLDGYCGNTSSTYGDDSWGALDTAFCGSIENNSFLTFQAASTSISMNVNVGNCTNGSGIQFMIFTTPTCGSGAVTSLGCFGNMAPGLNALTFTGLIPGQNYFLMIDGFAGAVCDYSVTLTSGGSAITDVTLTPDTPTMCMGQTLTLTAGGGNGVYNWSPATGLSALTGTSVVFTPPAPGTYTVTVQSTDTNALCSTIKSTVITVLDVVTPTFTQPAPICFGDTAPVLPTTSNNGVTGTWSPAVVDNLNSATYVFTPTAGQCGTVVSLDVTVLDQTIPSFITPSPICSGDVAPVLPTTSNNGITGTWSPAVVSNTASGTYVFTPNAGQCATTNSVYVEVLATCTFNAFATAAWIENCTNSATDGDFFNITGSGTDIIGPVANVFPSSDLGNYVQNSGNLIFRGAELKTFKTATSNVCSARLNYRVYEVSATPGAFTVINLPFFDNCGAGTFPTGGSCDPGDQKWQEILSDSESPVDLTTFAPGNYRIEVFFDVTGDNDNPAQCDDTIFVNNAGANYSATFSIQSNPVLVSTNPTTCNGTEGTITISGFTPNVTYSVTYSDDTVVVGPANYTANVSGEINLIGLNAGVYNNFSFVVNGCTFTSATQITLVDPVYVPTFAPIGPFCVGDTVTLPSTSIEGFPGSWTLGGNPVTTFDSSVAGTYTLNFVPAAGQCVNNSGTLSVLVNPIPTITSVLNPAVCFGNNAVFTIISSPNTTINYTINAGLPLVLNVDGTGVATITVNNPAVGNVVLALSQINNGACTTTLGTSYTVVVNPLPTASIAAVDGNICIGIGNAEFTITGTPNATVTYTINGGSPQTAVLSATGTYTITQVTPAADVVVALTSVASTSCTVPLTQTSTVVVTTIAVPTINVTAQPVCSNQTATFDVISPLNLQLNFPSDLFISEVTDAQTGSLTYVEIYNGTGSAKNLANYKLKIMTNGNPTPSAACNITLSGTIANNDVVVVKLSNSANITGIVPDLTYTTCNGVNNNDKIALATIADVELDVWGTSDGTPFTPSNGVGYVYRRLNSATLPSTTWNPADWTALDPEVYGDVGFYSLYVSNYEYILDGTTTQSNVTFTGVVPGTHTLVAHDLMTGCFSQPLTFTINPVVYTNPVVTFSYTTPVCISSTTNPLPDTSAAGFANGGTYSSTTGLAINSVTGEIDLSNSTVGSYVVTYSVAADAANCTNAGTSTANIVISPLNSSTFNSLGDVCENSVSPALPATSVEGYTGTWSPSTIDSALVGNTTYTFTPDAGQCAAVGTLVVTVINRETPTFNPILDLCIGSLDVTLPVTSIEGYAGTWSPAAINTSAVGTTTYTFTPDASICASSTTLDVVVINCEIPKGISPNNDTKNDTWDLSGYDIRKVEIFNRYGTIVYSKSGYENEWYGQSDNGNELPDGTYYYVIEFNDLPAKTGWVYINREQ
ncbi:MAG TPA: gliding motility-associated C-terminal domain-containing protein [Flavobacterium sp.]|uniref:T9SS type B sorting domain-containing protein n=1 Tax=Flavobacterium sp. TaxID=239 RepID=UPI002B4B7658|nr:gliding motility-associated C-terminal domain-containing protein [Flavobacterium sp.]HLO73956.1 gliding motility-associated C-terminal domain-containing protein [Flavobacterium sp.]